MDILRLTPSLLLLACSQPFGASTDSADDDSSGSNGNGGGNQGVDGLPSVDGDLSTGGCDDFDGTDLAGAATYFIGEFEENGDGYSGTERWVLYANPTWQDDGYQDCVVTWLVSATVGDTTSCGACDMGLSVSASVDSSASTCEPSLYSGDENFTVSYDVYLGDDGTSIWYFGESGTQFGSGYHSNDALNYVTEKSCTWF